MVESTADMKEGKYGAHNEIGTTAVRGDSVDWKRKRNRRRTEYDKKEKVYEKKDEEDRKTENSGNGSFLDKT